VDTLNLHNLREVAQETEVGGAVCAIGFACRARIVKLVAIAHLYPSPELCYNPNIEQTIPLSERSSSPHAGVQPASYFPAPAYDRQDAVFSEAFAVLDNAIAEHAFPAASIAVTSHGRLVALKAFGRFNYQSDSPAVTTASVFDLASVSKAVATTSMAMILYQRGLLDLETPVVAVVPEFAGPEFKRKDPRRGDVTLRMLLAHSSGLPAYKKLFLKARTTAELLAATFTTLLSTDPGTRAEYSDIGFIILGIALERIADETLDRFCQRELFGPLGMARSAFNPPPAWRDSIPPTADDTSFRHREIQGEVQDENASVLGGVAGHAGLFATAEDLATFAHNLLRAGKTRTAPALPAEFLRPETLALFTSRETSPPGTSRALGWDTPSSPSQSGKYLSARSFGHLGYTGTSLWIDLQRELSITLLTNRTWPDCANQAIKQVRPEFHDAVVEALDANEKKNALEKNV
jgi:CubicO group peptidase (beta-lactamase class C family)